VFKKRAIQLKFNEDRRKQKIENDLMVAQEKHAEAEEYRKYQIDEKLKNIELKKAEARTIIKE